MSRITQSATLLANAFKSAPKNTISAWPENCGPTSLEEGYQISNELNNILDKKQVGWKVVDTTYTRDTFNINKGLYGRLYSDKCKDNTTSSLSLSKFNSPRFEPHFTFKMASDIKDTVDFFTIQSKIATMKTSVEISDTRYDFSINDSQCPIGNYVADNLRSGLLLVGAPGNWMDIDIATMPAVIYSDKKKVQDAEHTDTLNPLAVLMRFLNFAVKNNISIEQDQYVSVALNFLAPQQVRADSEVVAYVPGMTEVVVNFKS